MKAGFLDALRLAQAGQAPVPGAVVVPVAMGLHEQLLASVAAREGAGPQGASTVPTVTPAGPQPASRDRRPPIGGESDSLGARARRGRTVPRGRGPTTIEEALGEVAGETSLAAQVAHASSQPQAPALQPDVVPGAGRDLRGGDGEPPEEAAQAKEPEDARLPVAGVGVPVGMAGGAVDRRGSVAGADVAGQSAPAPADPAPASTLGDAGRWPEGHPGWQACPVCTGAGTLAAGSKGRVPCGRCAGSGEIPQVHLGKPYAVVEHPQPDPVEAALAKEVDQPLPLEEAEAPNEATGRRQAEADARERCPEHPEFQDWCLECHAALAAEAGEDYRVGIPPPVLSYDLPTDLYALPPFCYVAGPAGTGKTFQAKAWAASDPEGVVLAATTGIAAVNLGEGCTINSLFKYYNTASLMEAFTGGWLEAQLTKLRRAGLRRVVLDEVSMLDGDQLTVLSRAFDNVNSSRGAEDPEVGLVLVGDFAQLPPVKASYAFESAEWERYAQATYKLTTIRRQADRAFIEALQAVRRGDHEAALAFFGPRLETTTHPTFEGTTILAKNEAVDKYNQLRLDKVTGAPLAYPSSRWGKLRPEWGGKPKPVAEWGVPEVLKLKVGALVMVLANRNVAGPGEAPEYLYVNGDLGVVEAGAGSAASCNVRLQRTGEVVGVDLITRENTIPLEPGRRKALRAEGHPERISANGKNEVIGAVQYLPLRLAWGTTVHKCVAEDTPIQTVSRGLLDIKYLKVGDVLPTGVVRGIAKTTQEAYRITTAQGYSVVASAEHRWVTDRGLQQTTALLVGADRLQLAIGRSTGGQDLDEDTAYWLGLLVGDGCYTDRDDGTLHFSSVTDQELGEAFARGAVRLGAARCSWRKDRRGLHTTCRALRDTLETWGVDYVTAPFKRIPWVVQHAHSGAWAAFLRGLFDADGSVSRSGVVLTTASALLAEDVQILLLALGIVSRRNASQGRKDPYWQVYVPTKGLAQYKALIGFGGMRKAKRLAETLPNRSLLTLDNFDTVRTVEPLGTSIPMVDIEVTAPHLAGFGPFVGHNSQGLSLDTVQVNMRDPFFASPSMLYVALSRARTAEGLRLVGTPEGFRARCKVAEKVRGWL